MQECHSFRTETAFSYSIARTLIAGMGRIYVLEYNTFVVRQRAELRVMSDTRETKNLHFLKGNRKHLFLQLTGIYKS